MKRRMTMVALGLWLMAGVGRAQEPVRQRRCRGGECGHPRGLAGRRNTRGLGGRKQRGGGGARDAGRGGNAAMRRPQPFLP